MIPEWLKKRHTILWDSFKSTPFRFEEATEILATKIHDDEKQINVILSELRKKGWLKVSFDPDDARKRIYQLKSTDDIMNGWVLSRGRPGRSPSGERGWTQNLTNSL